MGKLNYFLFGNNALVYINLAEPEVNVVLIGTTFTFPIMNLKILINQY
ncbi:hypothetical protein [Mucilaginibacter sp. SP1R1]